MVNGKPWNVEFDKVENVKDPGKLMRDRTRSRPSQAGARCSATLLGVLFDGVAYGSLLFIISIGLSVTMGLMNFINLAHGAFAMLGGYVCVMLMTRAGVPFLRRLPVAFVVVGGGRHRRSSGRSTSASTRPRTSTR